MALLSTRQVAKKLKFTPEHVRRLIRNGVLKATQMGHIYLIEEADLKGIKRKRCANGTRKN